MVCFEILFAALGKIHLFLTDTHMLPYVKLNFIHANASTSHPLPYGEDARICHTRGRLTCRRVKRVILGPEKFRQNVDIYESIFISKIFVYSIMNRALRTFHDSSFHVGDPAHLKLYALVT